MEAQLASPQTLPIRPPALIDLVKAGRKDAEIEALLTAHYGDEYLVKPLMAEVQKLRTSRAMSAGLLIVLVGAVFLLLSVALSIMSYNEGASLGFVLFGLTTVGIIVVFVGLVKIFG